MRYVDKTPLPPVCEDCVERKACLARGEGEWCCEECPHLMERLVELPEA